jgi:predicted enzyme related to lactoylglutathione lyase
MGHVTGLGGVFFKTNDPERLRVWYREQLGLEWNEHGVVAFRWRDEEHPEQVGTTIVSPFAADTDYFGPGSAAFMLNFRVDDLDGLLIRLRAEGVTVDKPVEEYEYGRFAWITDPDGRRVELWEPPAHGTTAEGIAAVE